MLNTLHNIEYYTDSTLNTLHNIDHYYYTVSMLSTIEGFKKGVDFWSFLSEPALLRDFHLKSFPKCTKICWTNTQLTTNNVQMPLLIRQSMLPAIC